MKDVTVWGFHEGFICTPKGSAPQEDFIVMQYVGLKDKNGTEIYEGDIILTDSVVVYRSEPELDRDYCCFGIDNGKYTLGSYSNRDDFKVIGNIYQNPELTQNDND